MAASNNLPTLTLEYLHSVTLGETDLIVELLDMFVEDGEMYLQQIQDFDEQADLLRAVHTLKGTAGQIGASQLEALGQETEKIARDAERWEETRTHIPILRKEFEKVCVEIAAYKKSVGF